MVWLLNTWRLLPPGRLQNPWHASQSYEPSPDYRGARGIYPYSVVPGGVSSAEEVEASIAQDPAVAEHYRSLHVSRLEPIRLNTTIVVYTSFRNNRGVHWTSHAIRVPKGELVLSDGVNLIRGRCGNRLSFLPPVELTPAGAPPELPKPPAEPEPPDIVLEYGMPPIFSVPPTLPFEPQRRPRYWPPPRPPIVWCCAVAGFPGLGPSVPSGGGSQPGVLEPASLLLLGTGLTAALLWWAGSRFPRQEQRMQVAMPKVDCATHDAGNKPLQTGSCSLPRRG